MDMDSKMETMDADGFTTPIQSPSPPDTTLALSEQYKYATESISGEQKSQQEASFMDETPSLNLGVPFNDILVQPHQPPTSGTAEASSSGIWSGFNNFFSNVATNPFPQAIPNLARNFTEYLSHYPQNLSNSLPTLGNSNSSGEVTHGNGESFNTNTQPTADGQSLDSKKLQIRVLGVPETGAKSRVETQIKLCMQLVTDKGEKVPLWSHLKLPEHMVARDKLKRSALMAATSGEGNNKIAITAMDGSILSLNSSKLLHLDARVICASDPSKKVITCFGCIQRERRRSQRKKENKNKSENDDLSDPSNLAFEESRVLLFNCSDIVDFSSGDTILPTRITCYCRHHDEKVGFRILFAMKDHTGKEIATGMSPPIMITDDHKSSKVKTGRKRPRTEYEHPVAPDVSALMRNAHSPSFTNIASSHSPVTPALSPAPEANTFGLFNNIAPAMHNHPSLLPNTANQQSTSHVLPATTSSPKFEHAQAFNGQQIKQERDMGIFPSFDRDFNIADSTIGSSRTSPNMNKPPGVALDGLQMLQNQRPTNHLLSPPPENRNQERSAPTLHRLIPNEGPTYGGIEVTVLGSGFHEGLTCMFGDSPAIPTHCWSANTLVCILPPSATSGTVVVSFKEHPLVVEGHDVVLFTYFNESDRALMELALQVVGLKMTGKVEDAREIAMRIVQGNSAGGSNNLQAASNQQQQQHRMNSSVAETTADSSRPVDLERQIIQVLDVMDTFDNGRKADLTLRNHSAQSMLHLACMLGFTKLTQALLDLGCPANALDRNGYTALHYASWLGHSAVVRLLLDHSDANPNVTNSSGLTPLDLAKNAGHYQIVSYLPPLNTIPTLPVISSEEDGASSGAYAASSEMDSELDYTTEDDTSSDEEVHNDLYIDEFGSVWLDGDDVDTESDTTETSDSANDDEDDVRSAGASGRVISWLSSGARKNRSSLNDVVDAVVVDGQPLLLSDDNEPVLHVKQEPNWMKRTFTHLQQTPLNHMIKSPAEMLHSMPPMLPNFGFAPTSDSIESPNTMVKSLTDHLLAFPRPVMPNFASISNMSMSSMFGGAALPNPDMMKSKTGEAEQTLAWYMALAYAMGAAKGNDESAFDVAENDTAEGSNRATMSRNVRKQHHSSSAYEDVPTAMIQSIDEREKQYLRGLETMEEKKRRDLMVALLTFQFMSTQPILAEWLIDFTDMKRVYMKV
ncbi:unnamed protein product [Umbelopsis vinacea]